MKKMETYLPPRSEEIQLTMEGIVAASGEDVEWGGSYNYLAPTEL